MIKFQIEPRRQELASEMRHWRSLNIKEPVNNLHTCFELKFLKSLISHQFNQNSVIDP